MKVYSNVLREMIEHARRESPYECCGLLAGRDGVIDEVRPCGNQRRSPVEFSIPVDELFEFFRRLRRNHKELMGVYHSHPGSEPFPSERDVQEFHYPGASYWIVSLQKQNPGVRCFGWQRSGFVEKVFSVLDETNQVL